jgi:hypothetical protein
MQFCSLLELRETDSWIQQDGATCHMAGVIVDMQEDLFGDRICSGLWPPGFKVLTLILKVCCYKGKVVPVLN